MCETRHATLQAGEAGVSIVELIRRANRTPFDGCALRAEVLAMHRSRFLGLNTILWRLASVVAIAQFAVSLWNWQFSVFLYGIVEEWQMGIVFASGTMAAIIAYPVSGFVADMVGRKKTILLAFIPMSIGMALIVPTSGLTSLVILSLTVPAWTVLAFAYGLAIFGWSFVLVVEKAMTADVLELEGETHSARTFTMVVAPAFLVDGLAPLYAALLLIAGVKQVDLFSMGSVLVLVALLAGPFVLKETLSKEVIEDARHEKKLPLKELGRSYWKLLLGSAGLHFIAWMTLTYWGVLNTDEWGLDLPTYGLTWSAFSIATAILTYTVGGYADRNLKASLVVGWAIQQVLMLISAVGLGIPLMFALNIVWAPSLILIGGAENALLTATVSEKHKGRALGIYTFMLNVLATIAMPIGAFLWMEMGSLRALYFMSAFAGLPVLVILSIVLARTDFHRNTARERR